MNINPQVPSGSTPSTTVVTEQSGAENVEGASATSLPGTSTEGMYPDSNNPSTSYHKPTKLGKRTASSIPDISDHETKKAKFDSNIIHENKYTSPNMETDQDVDENEIDVKPVQLKNIYDTITIAPDVDMGDYIQFPSNVNDYKELMQDTSFKEIKSQFLNDIKKLKDLSHSFVDKKYDNAIDIFYKNITENDESFHDGLLPLYNESRCHLRCLLVKLTICQGDEAKKDYVSSVLHDCLEGIDRCPAGIHARFQRSYIDLNASQAGLDGKLLTVRTDLLHQCIASFIAERQRRNGLNISGEMGIHIFNGLHNLVCESLNIEMFVDQFANRHLDDELIADFTAYIQLALCNSIIIKKISDGWSDQINSMMDKDGASEWKTNDILLSDIRPETIELLDSQLFKPISCFMGKQTKDMLTINNLMDIKDNMTCSLKRYRENFFGWLTMNFGLSKDNPQKISEETVFTVLPGTTSPQLYIGTIDGVFFWVFNNEAYFKEGQPYHLDTDNHITLELSHLTSIDFSNKPEKVIYSLLSQAIEQTNKAEDIASFFLNPDINKQLDEKTHWLKIMLFNQLTEKLTHYDIDFKEKLCECICDIVEKSNGNLITKEMISWLSDTMLLEPVLLKLQKSNIDITSITQSMTVSDIKSLSVKSIKQFLTPEHCCLLFRRAITQDRRGIVLSLLLTENCDELAHLLGDIEEDTPSFFMHHDLQLGVRYLLKRGLYSVTEKNTYGRTPLLIAAWAGQTDYLKTLLSEGANANEADADGYTALHFAIEEGNIECLRLLLDVENILVNVPNNEGYTPLHFAVKTDQAEIVKVLLTVDGIHQVQKTDKDGNTPIHLATILDDPASLNTLLAVTDIQVDPQNSLHNTPLHIAIKYNKKEHLKALLAAKASINIENYMGYTPLHYAATLTDPEPLNMLLNHNASLGVDAIQVDITNKKGFTPLHFAVLQAKKESIKLLLAAKASSNTALHFAIQVGNIECLRLLLDVENILVNVPNDEGYTPLHYAVKTDQAEIVKVLLTVDGIHQVQKMNKQGNTPLHVAIMRGNIEVIKALLTVDGIHQVNIMGANDYTPLHLATILDDPASLDTLLAVTDIQVDITNKKGSTPLHLAVMQGKKESIKLLLAAKASINIENSMGYTPLHYAATLPDPEPLKMLLNHNASLGVKGMNANVTSKIDNITPLHWAAMVGKIECIRTLLAVEGIEINIKDKDGLTPLQVAEKEGNTECADILRAAGCI
ncbi:MAG: ankyrin repeat domain-containing protein [Candidatus Endonucleobacter bathymodioli]|uniref:Ankyrin repeat domain-containing protein n=1 Tax=Candidatus Endonucleibacter bathymodioli TaxID=539814 RepID=A0AA90SST6_9GAMM|nr:ankyrin repeat domain-containing protein [Candidatus Endonucleobacter bathymodioli]